MCIQVRSVGRREGPSITSLACMPIHPVAALGPSSHPTSCSLQRTALGDLVAHCKRRDSALLLLRILLCNLVRDLPRPSCVAQGLSHACQDHTCGIGHLAIQLKCMVRPGYDVDTLHTAFASPATAVATHPFYGLDGLRYDIAVIRVDTSSLPFVPLPIGHLAKGSASTQARPCIFPA